MSVMCGKIQRHNVTNKLLMTFMGEEREFTLQYLFVFALPVYYLSEVFKAHPGVFLALQYLLKPQFRQLQSCQFEF